MSTLLDPPLSALRSLPLTILLGTAASVIGVTFLKWIGVLIAGMAMPAGPALTEYLALRAVAGALVGAGLYAAGRLPYGWLRSCLFCALIVLLADGDVDDFGRLPLHEYLSVWVGSSVLAGVVVGPLFHVLDRRAHTRRSADESPADHP